MNKMQTITAYNYVIIDVETKEILPIGDGRNGTFNFKEKLLLFFKYLNLPQSSCQNEKMLSVVSQHSDTTNGLADERIDCQTNSGYYGKSLVVYDTKNNKEKARINREDVVLQPFNAFFYITNNAEKNICVFHRYGKSGCKTIFHELLMNFVKEYGVKIELRALISQEYIAMLKKGTPTKVKLIKNTVKKIVSSDPADYLQKEKSISNNTEYELSINLKNKTNLSVLGDKINDWFSGTKTIKETFEFALPESFVYDETKVEVKINGQIRTFNFYNDGKLLCEYNITEELKYDKETGHPLYDSLSNSVNDYVRLLKS